MIRRQKMLSMLTAILLFAGLFASPAFASVQWSTSTDPDSVKIATGPVGTVTDSVYLEVSSQQGGDTVKFPINDPTASFEQLMKFEINLETSDNRLRVAPSDTLTAKVTVNGTETDSSQYSFAVENSPGIDVHVAVPVKETVTVSVYTDGGTNAGVVTIPSGNINDSNEIGMFLSVPFGGSYKVVVESATDRQEKTVDVTAATAINGTKITYNSVANGSASFGLDGASPPNEGGGGGSYTPPPEVSVTSSVYVYDSTAQEWIVPNNVEPHVFFRSDDQGNVAPSELLQIQLKNPLADIAMPDEYSNSIFKIVVDLNGHPFDPVLLIGRKFDTTFDTEDGMPNGWSYDDQTKLLTVYAKPSSFAVGNGGEVAVHAHENSILLAAGSYGSLSGAEREQVVATNRGLTLVTNAESFGQPVYVKQPGARPQLQIFVSGPHFMMDGKTLNEGFFQAYLPPAMLAEWGVKSSGQLLAAIGDGNENSNAKEVMYQADGDKDSGITLRIQNFNYSAHTISVSSQAETVAVTGVSLNKSSLSLQVGTTGTLVATVTPADAMDNRVEWSTSDAGVATVSLNGTVTAVGAGTATITATTGDGSKTASATVTVTAPVIPEGGDGNGNGGNAGGDLGGTGGIIPPVTGGGTPSSDKTDKGSGDEVVQTDDGVKLGEGASTITEETTPDGKTVTKVSLDESKFEKAIDLLKAKESSAKTITVEVPDSTSAATLELSGTALSNAQSATTDTVIAVKSGNVAYMLPVSSINVTNLMKGLKADLKDIKVQVSMEQISGEPAAKLAEQAKQTGVTLLANAVEFNVVAEANGKSVEITDFGSQYVSRSITMNEAVDLNRAAGVMVDAATGEFRFVPTTFESVNGHTVAVMKRPGNSLYTVVQFDKTFNDLDGHWAKADIERLASKFLIQGTSDSEFSANAPVTRAQLAAMLVRGLGLNETPGAASFRDVSSDSWYAGSVATAAAYGLVDGVGDHAFAPDATVSREQMAVMISRALKVAGVPASGESGALGKFQDGGSVSDYAKSSVAALVASGLLNGVDETRLAPEANASRAEAAVMLERMLKSAGFIN